MRVGFICSFGMSTYIVANMTVDAAKKRGLDIVMEAFPASEVASRINDFDLLLLGPQVRYKAAEIQVIAQKNAKKFAVIPSDVYGSMDGDRILDFIIKLESDQ